VARLAVAFLQVEAHPFGDVARIRRLLRARSRCHGRAAAVRRETSIDPCHHNRDRRQWNRQTHAICSLTWRFYDGWKKKDSQTEERS
jgi:hypothetical protein